MCFLCHINYYWTIIIPLRAERPIGDHSGTPICVWIKPHFATSSTHPTASRRAGTLAAPCSKVACVCCVGLGVQPSNGNSPIQHVSPHGEMFV